MTNLVYTPIYDEGRARANGRDLLANQAFQVPDMVEDRLRPKKRCRKCGQLKEPKEFGRLSEVETRRRSLAATCRVCVLESQNARRIENRGELTAKQSIDLDAPVTCSRCKETKTGHDFAIAKNKKRGISYSCRACLLIGYRERIRNRAGSESIKWYQVKAKFGITKEQWHERLAAQGFKCLICTLDLRVIAEGRRDKRTACLDHDHKTGKIRGFLCPKCNQGLGLLNDSPELLEAAAVYLRRHT